MQKVCAKKAEEEERQKNWKKPHLSFQLADKEKEKKRKEAEAEAWQDLNVGQASITEVRGQRKADVFYQSQRPKTDFSSPSYDWTRTNKVKRATDVPQQLAGD